MEESIMWDAEALGYLSKEEAEKIKTGIRERLDSLRQGPFGDRRMAAKERIIEKGV